MKKWHKQKMEAGILRELSRGRTLQAVAVALLLLRTQSSEAARRDSPKVTTILVLGDSLTAGYGVKRSEAYPALLTEKLGAIGAFEVLNAGVSGDTTAGALRRLPRYLDRPIDILILALGINDAFRGVPVPEMRANLQSIIDKTRARHPNIVLLIAGMQLPIYAGDEYVRSFGAMFAELAERNHAASVPYLLAGVGGDPLLNQPDRLHPNATGQKILAENVWRVLEPIARRVKGADTPTSAMRRID
ncbi:MAG: arylesterase [Chthoniobacterales bacterium]